VRVYNVYIYIYIIHLGALEAYKPLKSSQVDQNIEPEDLLFELDKELYRES